MFVLKFVPLIQHLNICLGEFSLMKRKTSVCHFWLGFCQTSSVVILYATRCWTYGNHGAYVEIIPHNRARVIRLQSKTSLRFKQDMFWTEIKSCHFNLNTNSVFLHLPSCSVFFGGTLQTLSPGVWITNHCLMWCYSVTYNIFILFLYILIALFFFTLLDFWRITVYFAWCFFFCYFFKICLLYKTSVIVNAYDVPS